MPYHIFVWITHHFFCLFDCFFFFPFYNHIAQPLLALYSNSSSLFTKYSSQAFYYKIPLSLKAIELFLMYSLAPRNVNNILDK